MNHSRLDPLVRVVSLLWGVLCLAMMLLAVVERCGR